MTPPIPPVLDTTKKIDTHTNWAGNYTGCATAVQKNSPVQGLPVVATVPILISITPLSNGAYAVTTTGVTGVGLAYSIGCPIAPGAEKNTMTSSIASGTGGEGSVNYLTATSKVGDTIQTFDLEDISTGTRTRVGFGKFTRRNIGDC